MTSVIPESLAVQQDLRAATEAAWRDSESRNTYARGESLGDLPKVTQDTWEADARTAILSYLRARRDREHTTNGQSSRWWALCWEIEKLEGACPA